MSIVTASLGFPRIGPRRELKTALENFWSRRIDASALLVEAARLRADAWARQRALGIVHIPSNDFSLYDHVLDTTAMVGAVPPVYGWQGGAVPLDTYFAMARGAAAGDKNAGLPALEMTKWFDTNYHYMVPTFVCGQEFALTHMKPLYEYAEAKRLGYETRPVLLGPVSYLLLGKAEDASLDPLSLLPGLLPVYAELLRRLAAAGAEWVQIDEPCLVLDLDRNARRAYGIAYAALADAAPGLKLLMATYFGALGDNLATALRLPVAGLHVDLARAPAQLDEVAELAPPSMVLSLGVVDGRNVWRTDLSALLDRIAPIADKRGLDRLMLAPSCSLLHVPMDLDLETELDAEVKGWLAFALQKLREIETLGSALVNGRASVADALAASDAAITARRHSAKTHDPAVRACIAAITPQMAERTAPYAVRRRAQRASLPLPPFPTTTIGSFPQTAAVRKARAARIKGAMSDADYAAFIRGETAQAVRWQEEIGLDVLVHGEFERNDMVQYFAERLSGYACTKHGWVQSYGSRCVRPPIIYGDVSRPSPMTVEWTAYAQSLTQRPMKGMLTGPVTMMQWSFVRDDLPRSDACRQIALAIRDEVVELEATGIRIIQIDEPALREGLPLRRGERPTYLDWAVFCFRLAASGVANATQIHSHMCYSEFNDIIDAIGALDADVISIETARSRMELLGAFATYRYPNEIGPGVYDIHAPRCPTVAEMVALLETATARLATDQIWVNPDCGLKTRNWEEVRPALVNMVQAAQTLRSKR